MENNEYKDTGDYAYTDLQLRELFENIVGGNIDYCRDMLTLFHNQKLERLREDNEVHRKTEQRQIEVEQQLIRKDD